MSVTIKVTEKTRKVLISLQGVGESHKEGLRNALHDIGDMVADEAAILIKAGPKTGKVYGLHQASAPGEAPADRTGRLAKSLRYIVHNHEKMVVGAQAPYAGYLEKGTRGREEDSSSGRYGGIKPRPFLAKAVHNTNRDAVNAILDNIKWAINKDKSGGGGITRQRGMAGL
jgi:hypothetical protein